MKDIKKAKIRRMVKRIAAPAICFSLAVCLLSGCHAGKTDEKAETEEQIQILHGETSDEAAPMSSHEAAAETEPVSANEPAAYTFPESWKQDGETVSFDCTVTVYGDVDVQNFHLPEVREKYIDKDAAYALYVEGKTVTDTSHSDHATWLDTSPSSDVYDFEDGSQVSIGSDFGYYSAVSSRYQYDLDDLKDGSQDTFGFATGEECVEKTKDALKQIGLSADEYLFTWISVSGSQYSQYEQEQLAEELIEADDVKGDWSEQDDTYLVYGYQVYEGLRVLPWYRSNNMMAAYDRESSFADVFALYSADGMLSLYTQNAYDLSPGSESETLLPFDRIAERVVSKYDQLLTGDSHYTVRRAKLFLRTYRGENQTYLAEPVWYIEETDDEGTTEILMFNAVTGDEVFLL